MPAEQEDSKPGNSSGLYVNVTSKCWLRVCGKHGPNLGLCLIKPFCAEQPKAKLPARRRRWLEQSSETPWPLYDNQMSRQKAITGCAGRAVETALNKGRRLRLMP